MEVKLWICNFEKEVKSFSHNCYILLGIGSYQVVDVENNNYGFSFLFCQSRRIFSGGLVHTTVDRNTWKVKCINQGEGARSFTT